LISHKGGRKFSIEFGKVLYFSFFNIFTYPAQMTVDLKITKKWKVGKRFSPHLPIFFIDQGALAREMIVVYY